MERSRSGNDRLRQELDRLCKSVMSLDGGQVLPLFFSPGLQRRLRLTGPPLLSGQLDKEFARRRLRADYLLHLTHPLPAAELLNHWEFQKKRERMGVRMSGYQTAAFEMHGVHVLSFVVNINDRSKQPWRLMREDLGPLSRCGWVEFALPALVRTWERPIRSPLGVVFSYLVEDVQPGMLLRCYRELSGLGLDPPACREVVEMLAFLLNKKEVGVHDTQILREDLKMLEPEEHLYYRYGVEIGEEKGEKKGMEKGMEKGSEAMLRRNVGELAEVLGIKLTEARLAHIAQLDMTGLSALWAHLRRERSWPDDK